MPLVSVLMPVFNRENLVGDAIRSIQNQTFHDWELIIVDDASTDNTLQVCRSYAALDRRIRVYVNEGNLGVSETRIRLNAFATGKYIAIQDSDDISVPRRLAWEIEVLEQRSEIGVVSGIAAFLDDDSVIFKHFPELLNRGEQYPQDKIKMVELLYQRCEVANPACMFRRSIIEQMNDPYGNYRTIDDWHFFLRLAHSERFWGIPEVLVKMRRGRNHLHIWNDYGLALKEVRRLLWSMYQQYKDDPGSPINFSLYRKCMSPWLNKHGRYLGGWRGYFSIIQSVAFDPSNRFARRSLWEFSGRALRKAKRLAGGSKTLPVNSEPRQNFAE